MNAVLAHDTHGRRLRALGVVPLRLRDAACDADRPAESHVVAPVPVSGSGESLRAVAPAPPLRIRRLALLADPAERRDPAINKMYTALTEAVVKAGLQSVRVCDVADDPTAALMVFGDVSWPAEVSSDRILRVEALAILHTDRERKRVLWERLQALGRGEAD